MKENRKILGIDASRSAREHPTGVERYSTEIIKALIDENEDFEIRLYTPRRIEGFPEKLQRVLWLPRLWTVVRLSLEMLLHRPDVLFIPSHVLPFFAPRNSFVTIHDVAFEKYPMAYGAFQSFYLAWSTRRALRRAKKVFVPTSAVKEDLIRYYKCKEGKIVVVHHGCLPIKKINEIQVKAVMNHYQLEKDDPLFLFIGRLETKKNLLVLLDAWEIVQKMYSKGRLFLGGMYGHGWGDLFRRMEDHDLQGTILSPGYISEEDAAGLFRSASALVLPSREEGFGMPILQAFDSECAVICSSIPTLHEVAGDAALYSEPGDSEGFAKQMIKILNDPKLKNELVKKGTLRLKEFSWKKAADKMMANFQKTL
ncbi:glycosyltransferase family 4 protein [Patescibacteria group bacterium]|nr:glycosyltransferase family 4 protein [Patescibacteria group bacterium]